MYHPREVSQCRGHDALLKTLHHLVVQERLPHGLLLKGDRGIGKATVAYRLARSLLAPQSFLENNPSLEIPPHHPVFKAIAQQSHPDLWVVESLEAGTRGDRAISIEQVRQAIHFLHKTSAQGGWRIVLIDGADLMTRQASNGLLKILEEPPPRSLVILISHGRILPTLQSRCQGFTLHPLSKEDLDFLWDVYHDPLHEKNAFLTTLARGSIHNLLYWGAHKGPGILNHLNGIFKDGPKGLRMLSFSQLYATDFAVAAPILMAWVAHQVTDQGITKGADVWETLHTLFSEAVETNLDPATTLLRALQKMTAEPLFSSLS